MSGRKHVIASIFTKFYTLARERPRSQAAFCAPIPACRRSYEIKLALSQIFCKHEKRREPIRISPIAGLWYQRCSKLSLCYPLDRLWGPIRVPSFYSGRKAAEA